jgi:transposase
MTSNSVYQKFIDVCLKVAKRYLQPYSSKFSKKTYTQQQLTAAVCLMKRERKTYRDIADLLPEFLSYFSFEKSVPHFTTLQKFMKRIPMEIWDMILAGTYNLFGPKNANTAIDSTGFDELHASHYYEKRVNRDFNKRRFMKHSILVDTDFQAVITSCGKENGPHDILDFKPLLSAGSKIVKIRVITADKGYDSEESHRFSREEIGAESIIPARCENSVWRMSGYYRKKMRRNFPVKKYHQRSKVETINSVEKRKFGQNLRSTKFEMRQKELKLIDIVYNIYRFNSKFYLLFVGFLQNPGPTARGRSFPLRHRQQASRKWHSSLAPPCLSHHSS